MPGKLVTFKKVASIRYSRCRTGLRAKDGHHEELIRCIFLPATCSNGLEQCARLRLIFGLVSTVGEEALSR